MTISQNLIKNANELIKIFN